MGQPTWQHHITRYSFPVGEDIFHITTAGMEARIPWRVVHVGCFLDKEKCEFVTLSSEKTRFTSKEEAYEALQKYLKAWERIGATWRRKDQVTS